MTVRCEMRGELRVFGLSTAARAELQRRATVQARSLERRFGELVPVVRPVRLWREESDALVLPLGAFDDVRRVTRAEVLDLRTREPIPVTARGAFRDHQIEIAGRLARSPLALLVLAATGSGKTAAAMRAAAEVRHSTLVLVPTVDLARQWVGEGLRFLGVEPGNATAGRWPGVSPSPLASRPAMVVATPETAAKYPDKLQSFGLLVVDEAHRFLTDARVRLIGSIPARYRLALTATAPSDHRRDVLRLLFGPPGYRFGVDRGLAAGVLVSPRYEQVRTGFAFDYGGADDWPALQDAIVASDGRNAQIADLVAERCSGAVSLVLSGRLAHLEILRGLLEARGRRVAILSGAVPKAERERALVLARTGEIDVLLASTVADEGIDLPALGSLVLAFPSRSEPRLLQRIGRVLRPAPGKSRPLVLDLVDDVGPLRRQAQIRAATFARVFSQREVAA